MKNSILVALLTSLFLQACSIIEVMNTDMGLPADIVGHAKKRSLQELDRLSATTANYISSYGESNTLAATERLLQESEYYKKHIAEYKDLRIVRFGFSRNPVVCGKARLRASNGVPYEMFFDFIASPNNLITETNGNHGDKEFTDAFNAGIIKACR